MPAPGRTTEPKVPNPWIGDVPRQGMVPLDPMHWRYGAASWHSRMEARWPWRRGKVCTVSANQEMGKIGVGIDGSPGPLRRSMKLHAWQKPLDRGLMWWPVGMFPRHWRFPTRSARCSWKKARDNFCRTPSPTLSACHCRNDSDMTPVVITISESVPTTRRDLTQHDPPKIRRGGADMFLNPGPEGESTKQRREPPWNFPVIGVSP